MMVDPAYAAAMFQSLQAIHPSEGAMEEPSFRSTKMFQSLQAIHPSEVTEANLYNADLTRVSIPSGHSSFRGKAKSLCSPQPFLFQSLQAIHPSEGVFVEIPLEWNPSWFQSLQAIHPSEVHCLQPFPS